VRQSLYKYFSNQEWAEAFLDGEVRFHSLAYFRDYEDAGIRQDENEGTLIFRPKGGLVISNLTQRTTSNPPISSFVARANQEEIFAFCTSRVLNDEMRIKFQATACVEIRRIQTFCTRLRNGLRTRARTVLSSGRVVYYDETEGGSPRYAFGDWIALSKSPAYEWQHEYRFIFSSTGALGFEKASYSLVLGEAKEIPRATEHHPYPVKVRALRDICRLHEL
jgi:hypothetical protein